MLLLGDSTSASAAYVGMTRGKYSNTVHVVADSISDAREQWVEAAGRGRADLGLESAAAAARVAPSDYAPEQQERRQTVGRLAELAARL